MNFKSFMVASRKLVMYEMRMYRDVGSRGLLGSMAGSRVKNSRSAQKKVRWHKVPGLSF